MNFYISDLHFGHKNIIKYDNRPFFTVTEMDEEMIHNWNDVVRPVDNVYVLGDFCWNNATRWREIIDRLNGTIHLVYGNHDRVAKKNHLFEDESDYMEIVDNGCNVVLCHYPILFYKNMLHGWIHLYGHVHEGLDHKMIQHWKKEIEQLYERQIPMYNVGASLLDYTPKTLVEIMEIFH